MIRAGDFMKMIDAIREEKAPSCPLYVVKDCTETLKKAEEVLKTGVFSAQKMPSFAFTK